jgi:putative endonuclease
MTEDIERRLGEHNAGETKSTRPYRPYELIYFEEVNTREEARKREKYFKTSAGRRFLNKQLLSNRPRSSMDRISDSGSEG